MIVSTTLRNKLGRIMRFRERERSMKLPRQHWISHSERSDAPSEQHNIS